MLCVFWDLWDVIWFDLLKPGETVTGQRYQQLADLNRALRQKRPEYQIRQHKVIFLDDNAPAHRTKKHLLNSASIRTKM